uniref:Integrase catalytic domain-containing protein n=1 Tax=Tanacetum cinerariifolium TaxID=118510 RepID=A0A699H2B4_TANCI|nr:hypothetical protein [Tanacetum cinerariifolium]
MIIPSSGNTSEHFIPNIVSANSSEGNFGDAIDIGLDVDHLVPITADAFPAVTIVTILASLREAIQGIHEYLQGVPIEEEMSTLKFRMGMSEAENASLRGNIRTMEGIETVTCSQERRTRIEMERHEGNKSHRETSKNVPKGGSHEAWNTVSIICIPTASDEFSLPDYFPTASEDRFPLLSERDAPAEEVCTADEVKAEGKETLEQTFNRLQAIISHLEFIGVEIEQDDLNQKFLTRLALEWLMYMIVWRNKSDLDTMSLDNLYNHLKVYEPEVQNKSELNSQNMSFISLAKTNIGKEKVNNASFSTASTQVSPASADVATANFSHDTVCAYIASQSNGSQTGKKITIQGTNVASFDKSKVECFNCHKMCHFVRECRVPRSQDMGRRENFKQGSKTEEQTHKALMAIDGEAPKEFALMAKSSSDTEDTVLFPLPAQVHSPPKKDMFWIELPEFSDDTITDYSRPSPSIESNSSDLQNSDSYVFEKGDSSKSIMSKPMIKFVKATDSSIEVKISKVEIVRKPSVNMLKCIEILQRVLKLGFDHLAYDCAVWEEQRKTWPKNNNTHKNSGFSRHMTGNISYLFDYESYGGGYVCFGQGGGKITGKGIIKTDKLDFENVYFVKDLRYNLFSVSQICDNKNSVLFTDSECIVLGREFKLRDDTNVLLRTPRQHNMYSIDLNNIIPHKDLTCLVAKASADESVLWHRRLGHLNFKPMNKLVRHNLVRGLPSKCFEKDHTCVAFLKRKQHKASCKTKLVHSVSKPLHTLHMDLFGPTSDETSGILRNFIIQIENLKELKVKIIRCDNGGEFRNKEMNDFCSRKGIKREFSNARTPRQNRVAERRNKTFIEAARTMVLVNKSQNKTPYELFNGRTHAIGFLKPFGCQVMIVNTLDNLWKFDAKWDESYFIGYSMSTKAFRLFNKRTKRVEENFHVDFLENKLIEKGAGPNWLFDIDTLTNSMNYVPVVVPGTTSTNFSGIKDAASQDVKKDMPSLRYIALPNWFHEAHFESSTSNAQDACNADAPKSSGNSNPTATSTNPSANHMETLTVDTRLISKRITSQDDTPSLDYILTLSNWFEDILRVTTNTGDTNRVEADLSNMENNISASPTPTFRIHKDHPTSQIIGPVDTPVQTRNKSKEMEEQIYQMDMKSAFLYGIIDEEVYVMQPPGF